MAEGAIFQGALFSRDLFLMHKCLNRDHHSCDKPLKAKVFFILYPSRAVYLKFNNAPGLWIAKISGSEIIFAETHSIYMQFNRPPPAQLVCVCLSLCVVHAQCCQVPGSPCRTGPAGIEQIRSLVSVVLRSGTILDESSAA